MTTFFDAMKDRLTENGLFDDQAAAVMQLVVQDESMSTMKGRWADDVSGYPPALVNITFNLLRPIAYDWICKNAPMAWYRPVFSPGIVGLKDKELSDYIDKYMTEKQGLKKQG